MADKPVTVEVPEDRVPEFYLWFAAFLASPPGSGPPRAGFGPPGFGRRGFGPTGFGPHGHHERRPWTADDGEDARWLYGRLSDPGRELSPPGGISRDVSPNQRSPHQQPCP